MGLPSRSTEVEFGPSQIEVTFHPMEPVEAADTVVKFKKCREANLPPSGLSRDLYVRSQLAESLLWRLPSASVYMGYKNR